MSKERWKNVDVHESCPRISVDSIGNRSWNLRLDKDQEKAISCEKIVCSNILTIRVLILFRGGMGAIDWTYLDA